VIDCWEETFKIRLKKYRNVRVEREKGIMNVWKYNIYTCLIGNCGGD
jgi:hypothetical protein